MPQLDCRGLNCPEPVIRTKQALEKEFSGRLIIIVDNETALKNVTRFLKTKGLSAKWEQVGNDYHITVSGAMDKKAEPEEKIACPAEVRVEGPIFLISADQLGHGSEDLGRLLIRNFIYTLTRREQLPRTVAFINAGVKLCTKDSPVLDELRLLQEHGVEILACGTCLDYFQLHEDLAVGRETNMYELAELLSAAGRVISL